MWNLQIEFETIEQSGEFVNKLRRIRKIEYHIKETYKLKEYFDNLLGYNLYDLFPEIKDNL